MARDDLDAEMLRLAKDQHGLVAVAQLRHLGADDRTVARRGRGPFWEAASDRVLRVAGSPATREQVWLAAVLDAGPGAVLSHVSAAALYDLPGFGVRPLHVTRPRRRARRPCVLALVHEPLRLPPRHVTVVRRVPVTTVARTLFDVAGVVPRRRAERALDNALSRRITTLDDVRDVAIALSGRGVPGSATMRRLLARRGAGYVAAESGLEAECLAWLEAAGYPPIRRQVEVGDAAGLIGRVDGLFADLPVIVEADSDLHHTSVMDRAADARRDARCRAAGFEVVRIVEQEIDSRDPAALARLDEARARAARRRGAA